MLESLVKHRKTNRQAYQPFVLLPPSSPTLLVFFGTSLANDQSARKHNPRGDMSEQINDQKELFWQHDCTYKRTKNVLKNSVAEHKIGFRE